MNKTYTLTITAEHPVVRNHRVHDQAVMPGLAYIDLLYQLAQRAGLDHRKHCLKHLSISNPLIVREDRSLQLDISFTKASTYWNVSIEGKEIYDQETLQDQKLYVRCELHEEAISFEKRISIDAMKQAATQCVDMETIYTEAGKRGLIHRGIIKAKGNIYITDPGCLIDVHVDESYDDESEQYLFHPALVDGAAMATGVLGSKSDVEHNKDLYLPLYYESFFSLEPLHNRCYAVVNSSSSRSANDIRVMDLAFFSAEGKQMALLKGITGKRVRFRGQIDPDFKKEVFALSSGQRSPDPPAPAPRAMENTQSVKAAHIEVLLRKIFSKHLHQSDLQIDLDTGFFELGLESSQLLAVVKDIEASFDLTLSPTLLFENSNFRELAAYLDKKWEEDAVSPHSDGHEQHENKSAIPEERTLSSGSNSYEFFEHEAFLRDHLVYDQPALMGVTHPCLVLESYVRSNPKAYPVELRNIEFQGGPVTLRKSESAHVQVQFDDDKIETGFKTVHYRTDPSLAKPCCKGTYVGPANVSPEKLDIDALIARSKPMTRDEIDSWYRTIENFTIGPMLQTIDSAFVYDKTTFIIKVRLSGKLRKGTLSQFIFDPLLLNSCYFMAADHPAKSGNIFVPLMIERLTVFRAMPETSYVVKTIRSQKRDFASFDAMVVAENGDSIAEIVNASLKEVLNPSLLTNASFEASRPAVPISNIQSRNQTDIAIVGLAGRYPQSYDLDQFWRNLSGGNNCITEIPRDRWDWREYYSQDRTQPGNMYSKWGGFIEDMDRFDPLFFNISPHEAEMIDPQERLFLEHCWAALEDAGYTRVKLHNEANGQLPGNVGVYVGVMHQEYPLYAAESSIRGKRLGLGGGISSIATRVSYFFDFHGPSMAVDTMCSSSLTAIYMARQALAEKRIDAALAGGVNLTLHPNKYLLLSQGQFISSKGRCESFGVGGDGYIPGEGVGVLFLKRLSDAERDSDHIYAVIKGAAINHGGRASGYTVPNPKAQSSVIAMALKESKIHPRTISYIEAHGTGTSLGDPIEISGLSKAFQEYTEDNQFCSIGSAKSNIGHCESAAGIAGITKVLLQMKHGQLAPSLHSKTLNPNIDFSNTPFMVQQELAEWKRPLVEVNGEAREYPRIAGISSFGAGGSNAHIVIEEYIPEDPERLLISITPRNPAIIVLSAKNEERLKEQAERLLAAIKEQRLSDDNLRDMAYTLQVGREAMEERLGVMAVSIKQLEEKLQGFVEGQDRIEDLYRGQVKRNKDALAVFAADEDTAKTIDAWIAKGKFAKLLDVWVKGLIVDWNKLYEEVKPRRISLPPYPFARERCWMPEIKEQRSEYRGQRTGESGAVIHPLLQQNTSDLSEQRFSSTFSGEEFFLADHVVKGQRFLPAVAYLEMARAAVDQAAVMFDDGLTGIRLKNVVWVKPIAVNGQAVQVHIGLFPEDNGEIAFEIYSRPEDNGAEPVVHSQGRAVLSSVAEVPILDIKALQSTCSQGTLTSPHCYQAFKTAGIEYGPGHRGLEAVYTGSGEVLAKLNLPSIVSDTADRFVLHPSLMDSALQASIGLMMGAADPMPAESKTPLKLSLPFALQELEVLDKCTSTMWAHIRMSNGSKAGDGVQKLDIDVCDEQGNLCVRMKGFSTRVLEGDFPRDGMPSAVSEEPSIEPLVGTIMLTPVWDTVPAEKREQFPPSTGRMVIVGGTKDNQDAIQRLYPQARVSEIRFTDTIDAIAEKLKVHGAVDHILWIAPYHPMGSLSTEAVIEGQNQGVLACFRTIKALLGSGYGSKTLGWTVITIQTQSIHKNERVNPTHASVHGLIGSMTKEYPNWRVRLIDLEADRDWPLFELFMLPPDSQGNTWAYRGEEWYRQKLIPVHRPQLDTTEYKTGGVYVVIGGSGGIGEVWSEYVIRTYQAQVIWIGRKQMDEAIQAKLDRLATLGPAPLYLRADATDKNALQQACEEIKTRYSRIHGVIHSAIVLLDQSLANMDEERFRAGLSAKVDVSVRMAQIFAEEPLDFVMFFSSINAFSKAAGQSNYVAGCTFKDAFAQQLGHEWPCPVKVMNWGYWGSVGVVASKEYQERMAQMGIGSIEPPEAMKALETLLAGPIDQIALMKTTKPLFMEGMNPEESVAVYPQDISSISQSLQSHISEQGSQIQGMKSEMGLQMQEMDELLCKLLWCQLQSLGLFAQKHLAIADLKTRAGLRDSYDRWLKESIAVLERNNYLSCDGKTCTAIDMPPVDRAAVWKEWDLKKGGWLEDPNMKAQVVLAEATLRALPEILTGKVLATDIMFPNSSMELVEGIYKNNPIADYFNEILSDTVAAYIQERVKQDSSARIRIIEIGAGTGGTSAKVFQKLKRYQDHLQEYCYTDISKAFLLHAEKEYGRENPYLTYKIFDVEAPIAGRGIEAGGYDIVIATNVLHATQKIRQTLRNAKAVLKKNGLILINEMSGNALFTHLTFGLLEGWWCYQDHALRIPGCPGLSAQNWQGVLEREGFRTVLFPARESHELGQQIIVAESDGIVRQKQRPQPHVTPMRQRNAKALKKSVSQQKPPMKQTGEITADLLREKTTAYVKKLIAEALKMPSHKIDSSEPLEKYGLDSILVVHLTNTLNKVLDNISSTLLFEYQTIDALVEHFIKTRKESLIALIGLEDRRPAEGISGDEETVIEPSTRPKPSFRKSRRFLQLPEIEEVHAQASRVREVAIIGLSGRYPLADNVNEFWGNLKEGKHCITEIPRDRWDWKKYFDEEKGKKGTIYTKWGGFIGNIDKFDPLFFHISPADAEQMDPQERLFLQAAYASIEDAGYTPATLCASRKIGVFVGAMNGNYPSGSSYWSIANRLSYVLNFQGPSMAVDSACSSSLTAIHLAMESLQSGTSECAIAGGVNLIVDPVHYARLSAITMLSPGDKCKSFGDQADGFVVGEGVGAIVLKPLQKAIADEDHIYGIIKGSMLNAGGKTSGYSVPNPNAHFQLIVEALQRAMVNPRTVSYIEAHGTGTSLGDPIEIGGLTKAFREYTNDKQFCAIGSVKSNIGHCESAAGIAGITKVLLQMKHGQLTPSLHSNTLNPNIDFSNTPFTVQQELAEWKRPIVEVNGEAGEYPRIAGISSFGAGGSNAHIVIEEYIPKDLERPHIAITTQNPAIIVLSAKNEERLKEQVQRLLSVVQEQQYADSTLADMAYTLQVGREAMEERLGVMAASIKDLEEKLKNFLDGQDDIDDLYRGQVKRNKDTLAVFAADEDLQKAMDSWIAKRKYGKLLDLWVKGLIFDWNKLYGDVKPRRISLPTYPFARERHWTPEAAADALSASGNGRGAVENRDRLLDRIDHQETAKPESEFIFEPVLTSEQIQETSTRKTTNSQDDLMYLPLWEEQPLSTSVSRNRRHAVLIVYHDSSCQFEKTIQDYYRQNELTDNVIQIQLNNQTNQVSENTWRCDISDPKGFETCLHDYDLIDCLYFISQCQGEKQPVDFEALARSQQNNEVQLLRLIMHLKRMKKIGDRIDCYIITQDNYRIADMHVSPYGGGVTGLAYAIAQEDRRFSVRNIDISLEDGVASQDRDVLLKLILAEEPSDRGEVIKFKAGSRYRQVFLKLDPDCFKKGPGLKEGGVYVILGGSGTVGGIITRYLIQHYNAKIVWIGRKPETSDVIQEKIEFLRTWGEPPHYIQADVTSLDQMKEAVARIKRLYSTINGAIFSGLVIKFGKIDDTEEDEFMNILDVKTKGTLNFYTAFQDEPVDFMCYFSSIQAFSFTETANTSAYASGITFSDTFIRFIQDTSKFPVGTINWGYWKASVGEAFLNKNLPVLEDEEGFHCFEYFTRLLQGGVLNQAVCKPVRALMNSKEKERITIYESCADSVNRPLWNSEGRKHGEVQELRAEALIKRVESKELQEWVAKLLFIQMRKFGLFRQKNEPVNIEALWKEAGGIDKYDRWIKECLGILKMQGYVQCEAGLVNALEKPDLEDGENVWKEWESFKESYLVDTEVKTNIRLMDACLQKLPEILTGSICATDILFPNSSMEMVKGVYKNDAADYFNAVVADLVENHIKQRLKAYPRTKVRIIEAGAGTGGTSATVFAKLEPYADHIEYCYTDISKSFLMFAEEQYGPKNPYLRYKLWNIEKALSGQEVEAGHYDIAIATNVVHATKSIRQTIRNIKAALKAKGILLLNELIQKNMFAVLTFGLLDGWWLYEDEHLRIPGSPILHPETWKKVLQEEGFRQIHFPVESASKLGQQIIAAQSDGIVRQEAPDNLPQEEVAVDANGSFAILQEEKTDDQLEINQKILRQTAQQKINDVTSPNSGAPDKNLEIFINTMIVDHLSRSLKVSKENIDTSVPFSDYGVDSIIAVNFIKQVNDELGVNVNSAILFDYTTVDRLTKYLVKTYHQRIKKHVTYATNVSLEKMVTPVDGLLKSGPRPGDNTHQRADDTIYQDLEKQFYTHAISAESLIDAVLNKSMKGFSK